LVRMRSSVQSRSSAPSVNQALAQCQGFLLHSNTFAATLSQQHFRSNTLCCCV